MKYIKLFKNISDASIQGNVGLFSPHIDIVKETNAINFAKTSTEKFNCSFNSTTGLIENVIPIIPMHNLGDIAYWDGSKVAFVPYTSWQSSLGTALGVCFIPTSHARVWGDGKARFLAVTGVNADGTASDTNQKIAWDSQKRDAGLTKYTNIPTWDNTIGGSIGTGSGGAFSSDYFSNKTPRGPQNVIDTLGCYGSMEPYIPSPYAADGSFYSDYIREILSEEEVNINALLDLNGKTNTAAIVDALGADGGEAAKACSLYSTSGIASGEWYLPAMGELGYLAVRWQTVQDALSSCNGTLLPMEVSLSSNGFMSSTEVGANYFRGLVFVNYYTNSRGVLSYYIAISFTSKSSTAISYVRPVCALD